MNEALTIVLSLFGLAVAAVGAVTGLVFLYGWLRNKKQGYPNETLIEAAVLPYIYNAIMAAYKASEAVMDATGDRLQGLDKAKIAAAIYAVVPESLELNVFGRSVHVPVKQMVPPEKFEALIQRAFDEFTSWYQETFDKWGDAVLEHLGDPVG